MHRRCGFHIRILLHRLWRSPLPEGASYISPPRIAVTEREFVTTAGASPRPTRNRRGFSCGLYEPRPMGEVARLAVTERGLLHSERASFFLHCVGEEWNASENMVVACRGRDAALCATRLTKNCPVGCFSKSCMSPLLQLPIFVTPRMKTPPRGVFTFVPSRHYRRPRRLLHSLLHLHKKERKILGGDGEKS